MPPVFCRALPSRGKALLSDPCGCQPSGTVRVPGGLRTSATSSQERERERERERLQYGIASRQHDGCVLCHLSCSACPGDAQAKPDTQFAGRQDADSREACVSDSVCFVRMAAFRPCDVFDVCHPQYGTNCGGLEERRKSPPKTNSHLLSPIHHIFVYQQQRFRISIGEASRGVAMCCNIGTSMMTSITCMYALYIYIYV